MTPTFFLRRFLQALAIAVVVIGAAQYLKGNTIDHSIREAVIWGLVSATVYTAVLAYKSRHLIANKGQG